MNIQIETVTLADGSKMDVIRDLEKVQKVMDIGGNLATCLRRWCDHRGELFCESDAEAIKEWEKLQ